MQVRLIAFGIAKDILKSSSVEFSLENGMSNIGGLKQALIREYPDFEKLRSLRFAVNEDYQDDDYGIQPDDEVVIIPPVSGG